MALNRSVRAFIKSPWTQCDYTQLLKKALHTLFFCVTAKHFQTEKNKQKKQTVSCSARRYDANPSTTLSSFFF